MSDDLIEKAEALIRQLNESGEIEYEKLSQMAADEMLPELVAEIKLLRGMPKSGLYGKYTIQKSDGSPMDPNADYFVLRLDIDPIARLAALEYSYQTDDETLAHQISDRVVHYLIDQPKKRPLRWEIKIIEQMKEQLAAKDLHIAYLETMTQATSESHLQFVNAHFEQESDGWMKATQRMLSLSGGGKSR